MGLSNQHGHLVLATGNKSELAVGYSTLYGDSVGGFAPLKDVPKTLVWQLARWRNAHAVESGRRPPVPESSISKEPSAELRPGQLDSDSLPDYVLLDDILDDYVERDRGPAELLAAGFDPQLVERVLRLTDTAEFNAGSTHLDRRSRSRRSAGIAGCPSPTGGASSPNANVAP
jgi:NAD+ synthase (glutamine-hydrolysing)